MGEGKIQHPNNSIGISSTMPIVALSHSGLLAFLVLDDIHATTPGLLKGCLMVWDLHWLCRMTCSVQHGRIFT